MNRIIYLSIICLVSAISCYAQCDEHTIQVIEEKKLLTGIGRVRSIETDGQNNIYIGVENLGILKLIH